MTFDDFIARAVSDCVNARPGHPVLLCRLCGRDRECAPWTHHKRKATTAEGMDHTLTTGLCDDCLEASGPDERCVVPEDDPRTAAEVHGETELELSREWGGQ